MSKGHGVTTAESLTLVDYTGLSHTVSVQLTPRRKLLTEATKRRILATGYLLWYGERKARDERFIEAFLECIRRQVLACRESEER